MSKKTPLIAFALAAALAAPSAFAQSQTEAPPAEAAEQATEATTSNDASAMTQGASAPKKSWADVDADKDGKLTQAEAAAVPALSQVFGQADANADGTLTAEEYKAFLEKSQGQQK